MERHEVTWNGTMSRCHKEMPKAMRLSCQKQLPPGNLSRTEPQWHQICVSTKNDGAEKMRQGNLRVGQVSAADATSTPR